MAPLRVGIVGLSTSPGGSGWAKRTHLPYLQASPDFIIAGVLNSTLESSKDAIRTFQLSETAEAYVDIEDMAGDVNIDLITVCVEVKKHAEIVKVALECEKQVFCEWPLAKNLKEAEDLYWLAKKKHIRGWVGLESRVSPVVLKLRELLSSSAIGKVLNTTVTCTLGPPPTVWSEKALFYLDIDSGQSPLHTRVGHLLDAVCYTVGELERYTSAIATHANRVEVYDVPVPKLAEASKDPGMTSKSVRRSAPDEILLQGKFDGGAIGSIHIRSGSPDSDGNILRWTIGGTEGLIEVTQKTGQFLRDRSVEIKVVKNGQVEKVDINWELATGGSVLGLSTLFATPGRIYQAIADGNEEGVVDFEHAVKRHEMIDNIILGRDY